MQKRLQHRHKVPAAVAEYFPLKNPAYVHICNKWPLNRDFVGVCGQPFRPVRFDALTCSTTCRIRKSRGADLAYLSTLPPDQARARHAIESEVAIARDIGASTP